MILKYFNFFLYGSIGILMSFFPLYFQTLGLTGVEIGMIMAGGPFISIIANPTWGYWSDRIQNLKKILIIMLLGTVIVVQFVFHLNHSLIWIFTTMLVFFFFQTPMFSQSNTLILNAIEGTKYKFGGIRFWGSLGWALMALVGGPILNRYGVNNLWVIYTILIIVTLALCIQLPQGEVEGVKKIKRGEYRKALFGNKYFLTFVILGVLISVPNSINLMFVSLYIDQLGGSMSLIGWATFMSAILEVPVFILLDRYLKKQTSTMIACLIVISILFALRWILMAIATDPVHIVLIQSLHAISFGGYFYIGTILTTYLTPANMRASGQAVYAISWAGISGVIAGTFGGWMFQELGPKTMYGITTTISLLGGVGLFLLWQKIRKDMSFVK